MNSSAHKLSYQLCISTFCLFIAIFNNHHGKTRAEITQVTPDQTLGQESSIVNQVNSIKAIINGGVIRGTNLFHSFQEFNIGENNSVYFANPIGIENILTRITGSNQSQILGILGVEGTANLFFMNPQGILFGKNASLDMRGSFTATTADSIRLGENGLFSATNPQNSNLLTIKPSALFIQRANQNSRNIEVNQSNLGVDSLQTLALIGDDLMINNSNLTAPGGRIELAAISEPGILEINFLDKNFTFNIPDNLPRGDIAIADETKIDVSSSGGGTIVINARNLPILGGSRIQAGISNNQGANDAQAGNIEINTTGNLTIDSSLLFNRVFGGGMGNSGDINITANSFSLINGGELNTSTAGQGNAGNINIHTQGNINLTGEDNTGFPSNITSDIQRAGIGKGGNITITGQSLSVTDGSFISARTSGTGNAGNVNLSFSGDVVFLGEDSSGFSSGIFNSVQSRGIGDGGNIYISANSLLVKDGAEISASTSGRGNAGDIFLKIADLISVEGTTSNNFASVIHSDVYGVGDGGNLEITAKSLSIADQASLSASTGGEGNSGNIKIDVEHLIVDGFFSGIFVGVGRTLDGLPALGNGGNIQITADTVNLNNSAVIQLSTSGIGNVGSLQLDAKTLSLTGGSEIQGSAFGTGTAGDINLNVIEFINLSGVSIYGFSSGLFSGTREGSQGEGGNITVNTGTLSITDGAVISGRTRSFDPGGNITINSDNLVLLNGGQILSTTYSSGTAGNIFINTKDRITIAGSDETFTTRLQEFGKPTVDPISSHSGIAVNSQGSGEGGDITIFADSLNLQDQAFITAETFSSNGGNISINNQNLLLLRNDSQITVTAGTAETGGNGGNININSPLIVAFPNENSDITANAFQGNGGRISINSQAIFGLEFRPQLTNKSDITASSQFGLSGEVQINTPNVNTSAVIELADNLVDPTNQLSSECTSRGNTLNPDNSFTVVGRGGLPFTPDDLMIGVTPLVDLVDVSAGKINQQSAEKSGAINNQIASVQDSSFQEAQGWIMTKDGRVFLTANTPKVIPHNNGLVNPGCH